MCPEALMRLSPQAPATKADNGGDTATNDFVDGWYAILKKLRSEVIAYGKPVVLVHGDSHTFIVDKPFVDSNGLKVENFTRVETFGDNQPTTNDNHGVKVLVDPNSRDVFAFQPQIVPANVLTNTP